MNYIYLRFFFKIFPFWNKKTIHIILFFHKKKKKKKKGEQEKSADEDVLGFIQVNTNLCGKWPESAWNSDSSYAGQTKSCAAITGFSNCHEWVRFLVLFFFLDSGLKIEETKKCVLKKKKKNLNLFLEFLNHISVSSPMLVTSLVKLIGLSNPFKSITRPDWDHIKLGDCLFLKISWKRVVVFFFSLILRSYDHHYHLTVRSLLHLFCSLLISFSSHSHIFKGFFSFLFLLLM